MELSSHPSLSHNKLVYNVVWTIYDLLPILVRLFSGEYKQYRQVV